MSFDRVSPAEQERDWIEKYRAALQQNPARPSRVSRILTGLTQVFTGKKKVSPTSNDLQVRRKPVNISAYPDREQGRQHERSNNSDLSGDATENKAS
jgi:hypothetical protein